MSHCVLVISLYMYMTYMHVLFLVHLVLADQHLFFNLKKRKEKKGRGPFTRPSVPPFPSRAWTNQQPSGKSHLNSYKRISEGQNNVFVSFPITRQSSSGVILPISPGCQSHCHFKSLSLDMFQGGGEGGYHNCCCFYVIHFYIIIYIHVYIHTSFFYWYQVFILAILVGCSALFQCACILPAGSCVGLVEDAYGPGTWGPQCPWDHCCGGSLESHVHVVAGSPCIPIPPPCRGFSRACLQDCCWSPAPRPCSHAIHVVAGPTRC